VRRIFDYYRQFEELTPEEVSARLIERRNEERARSVVEVPVLDLSSGAWPGPPHPEAVNAATFALRRALNAYPDAGLLPAAVAAARGVQAAQVAPGHGAGELLRAALATVAGGGEVAVAWPGWGPLPRLVHEAGGTPVPVALDARGAADAQALLAAVGDATRAVALCTPNDPTGAEVGSDALAALADGLPERVWLLVDAALAEFGTTDLVPLLERRERVLLVHSGAKAHALAGLRAGYALGPPGTLLERLTPSGGIASPAQAALAWSVEHGSEILARRRAAAAAERERLAAALDGSSFTFADGVGPLVWLRSSAVDGRTLASQLATRRITVMPGEAWGDDAHVRITLRDAAATDRLVAALRETS
jgi:histidinol-phosphate/aromatic aminotransferase/cobyric acid decarboxylase-like protein